MALQFDEPDGPARTLSWIGGAAGSWNDSANWRDLATNAAALTPPTARDTALVDGGSGSGTQITGAGVVGSLQLSGSVVIDAVISTGGLVDTDTAWWSKVSLTAGGSLIVGGSDGLGGNSASTPDPVHPGFLVVATGATLVLPQGVGTVPIWNDGTVRLSDGSAVPGEQILGSGTVLVESGFASELAYAGMLNQAPSPGADQHIRFDGPNAALYVAGGATENAPILVDGFDVGDVLGVNGAVEQIAIRHTDHGDLVDLTEMVGGVHGMMTHQYLQMDRDLDAYGLVFASRFTGRYAFDAGYTELSLQPATPCFCLGTLIATPDGERAVETLRIGDLVRTADGADKPVLWIGRRSYPARMVAGRESLQPILIRAGALGTGLPRRDLFVSPRHAMLVRNGLVPAELLVNNRSILRHAGVGDVSYLHLELDQHDLLLAEGARTESFVDNSSRSMFQNAAEYAALYPDRPERPARWCVPRIEEGEPLLAAQRFVNVLAGLMPEQGKTALDGAIDSAGPDLVRGWAWCPEQPDAPVLLEILSRGAPVMRVLADRYRADLAAAGIGTGCHGFEAHLPRVEGPVDIRRVADGRALVA